ncbi:MAG TPA: hypothetical protein VMS89_09820 [Methanoregulaceae archaeon]|nr:hypothetical protein [Methanoregulaceae archaeon]
MAVYLPPPESLSTGIGGLPYKDPEAACDAVLSVFTEFPYVPLLPNRGFLENIVINDSEKLPGRVLEGEKLTVDRRCDLSLEMEQIYLDYIEGNFAPYSVGTAYASGLYSFLKRSFPIVYGIKCQVTGPVTFGMQVVDADKRPIYYDSQFADVLSKMLALRARWYEHELKETTGVKNTLILLNEPYLASLGSSVVPIDMDSVRSGWDDIVSLVEGSIGIHCCSNTDWGFLFSLGPAVVSFDAYTTSKEILLYRDELLAYMESGGVVAWGIVPAEWRVFSNETTDSLYERYLAIRSEVTSYIPENLFDAQSLITPSCGIRFANEPQSIEIMKAAAEISRRIRSKRT